MRDAWPHWRTLAAAPDASIEIRSPTHDDVVISTEVWTTVVHELKLVSVYVSGELRVLTLIPHRAI